MYDNIEIECFKTVLTFLDFETIKNIIKTSKNMKK